MRQRKKSNLMTKCVPTRSLRLLLAGLAACAAVTQAPARSVENTLASVVHPLIDQKKCVGVAVGIIHGDAQYAFGYGQVRQHTGQVPDADTLFEIGSITKTFVGTLLAQMVQEGLVRLDDPVLAYLPEGTTVPAYHGREITLLDLATHTSGLPRNPGKLWVWNDIHSIQDLFNPFVTYTPERLYAFLAEYQLEGLPGKRHQYSNLGAGLLGHALALRAGLPFEQLVLQRICGPLGLDDTRVTLSADQRARVAPGYLQIADPPYFANPYPSSYKPVPALAGAGTLRSTVRDMLMYLAANMALAETPCVEAMAMAQEPRYVINERQRIGLFWQISDPKEFDEPLYHHSGRTGGYYSFVGFLKERRLGVVVLSNGISSVNSAALSILRSLARQDQP